MSAISVLHEAAAWSLSRIGAEPPQLARAEAALARCLGKVTTSAWPEVVDRWSGLNADGCPFELAFSSRDHAIRFTCEVAGPELADRERLARADELLVELGGRGLPAMLRERFAAWQADAALAWGAAVAGCYAESGDHLKIYVEPAWPLERAAPALAACLRRAGIQRVPRLVMVGYGAGTATIEHYLRSDGMIPGELAKLVEACGLSHRLGELERAISIAWQGSAARALEGVWGISLAESCEGDVVAISVFKEANRLLGGDAIARGRLLALVAALEAGELEGYARLSEPLAAGGSRGAHGMLAFTVARCRPLELRVGLNPLAVWRAR